MAGERVLTTLRGWSREAAGRPALADCSLILATYKRPREVCTLLERVRTLPDAPAEVVVVDGSPGAETEDAIRAWVVEREIPFHLIYVRSPAGLTRQRNVGIDACSGSIVFFLDDDCRPEPGYFQAIRRVYAADEAGAVGAVCGSPVNEMNGSLTLRWRARLALGIAPRGKAGDYLRMGASMPLGVARPFSGTRPSMVMPGCAMSFRRPALERHRFSHFFYGYSQGEDLEMSLRVARDFMVLWCGDAHLIHDHAPGGRPASMEKGRMEVRNRFFIWKRNVPEPTALDRIRFWGDTAYSIAYDVAAFVRRPTSLAPFAHMLGCMRGALQCFVNPPRHDEPPAAREFDFDIRPLAEYDTAAAGAGR
jgi:GT2 family glycosyltransferase